MCGGDIASIDRQLTKFMHAEHLAPRDPVSARLHSQYHVLRQSPHPHPIHHNASLPKRARSRPPTTTALPRQKLQRIPVVPRPRRQAHQEGHRRPAQPDVQRVVDVLSEEAGEEGEDASYGEQNGGEGFDEVLAVEVLWRGGVLERG